MKNCTLLIKKSLVLLLALWMPQLINGATFVATTSGNFSSSTTWAGGIVPPLMNTLDEIVISPGVTVSLDQNLTLNGALAVLDVQGTLTASNNSTLTIDAGTISGSGVMMLEDLTLNAGTLFVFDGDLTSDMIHVATTIVTTATLTVNEMLQLMGGTIEIVSGGSLDLVGEATIIISNGVLSEGIGGFIDLTDAYDVVYLNNSAVAGIELTGPGLQDLTVDLSAGQSVTATLDIVVNGTLSMASGVLVLADMDLTVNGTIDGSGSGTVSSTAASDIFLNTTGSVAGTLDFAAGAAVNNLNVNAGSSNTVGISGDVIVEGALQLTSGVLSIADASLTVNGDVTGSGMLSANAATDLVITHTGALSSALTFAAGGQVVQDLSLSVGDNAVSLGSDLSVQGALDLAGGSNLDLNGQSLTLGATSALTGSGSLLVDAVSDLTIESTGGISSLPMVGTVGNLTVNTTAGTVSLGGDASVSGMFNLASGTLSLNGHDLTLSGDIAAGGTGTISSSPSSNISVTASASPAGSLSFSSDANSVGNLNINIGYDGELVLGSDLQVMGGVQFIAGQLDLDGHTLDITASASFSGAGINSYVITEGGGTVKMNLTSGASASFPVGTASFYAPAEISLDQGSASGNVQVRVENNVMTEGTSGVDLSAYESVVDATWHVSSDITTNLDMNMNLAWQSSIEVNAFDHTQAYISHYTSGEWDSYAEATAVAEGNGMFSISRSDITNLSPFAVFDRNTVTGTGDVQDVSFKLYPNPSIEEIIIESKASEMEHLEVVIYNSAGQSVKKETLTRGISTISVRELTEGNYFIQFSGHNGFGTKQFTKI